MAPTRPPSQHRAGVGALIALALSLSAMGASGYRFGVSDQLQYLSHYVALRWPGMLGDDAYLRAFEALGSYLWAPMAMVPQDALPLVSALVTIVVGGVSAAALMGLGRALAGPGLGAWGGALAWAAPAMALVTPKEQNYFGLVSLSDVELTATLVVLPLAFASIAAFVRGRLYLALAMGLLAVPVHGQTAAYILAAWCAGVALCDFRNTRRLSLALGVGLLGLGGAWLVRGVGPVEAGSMRAYERLGRELYAPLIDLWSVPARSWMALGIVLAFGLCALPGFLRVGSGLDTPHRIARERLAVYALASLAFPLLGGALLGLGVREPLLWRLMVPRSMMLAQIVSVVIAAVWASDRIRGGGRDGLIGLCALVGLIAWPVPGAGHVVAGALGALIVALILGASVARARAIDSAGARSPAPLLGAALGVAALVGVVGRVSSGHAWARSSAPGAWVEAQRWAREHTPEGSVFVTPPYLAGWRVGSHRPTFGELRDGGLLFYSGQAALAWEARMRLLGMDSMRAWWWDVEPGTDDPPLRGLREAYRAALSGRVVEVLERSGADYLVIEGEPDPAWGERVWGNGAITIVSPAP